MNSNVALLRVQLLKLMKPLKPSERYASYIHFRKAGAVS